jgi:hypothetical protein
MKHFLFATLMTWSFASVAHAEPAWTEVVSTTLTEASSKAPDILIHNSDTYSEVKVKIISEGARIDAFQVIPAVLWGHSVPEVTGDYAQGAEREGFFKPTKVRFVRIYARSLHPGLPVQIKVWMR